MRVSLTIQDKYYQQFLDFVKTLPSNAISVLNKENDTSYINSEQYKKDKKYFQNSLDEIEKSKVELVPFDIGLDKLDSFIDNV